MLGRCAGVLFLAGAIASAPANQLLSNPEPGWYMHLIDLLAFVSGVVCLRIRWDRIDARWLHAIPPVATAEIVLTVRALGVHGEVYLWFFVLGAVFNGYAFRRRRSVVLHTAMMGVGFGATAVAATAWDQDALVRCLVAIPTLGVAAGVVAWLREGLEAREREHERQARSDALTGLANRRVLLEDLGAAVRDPDRATTLVLFDLDGFKLYNDRFGHPAGDAVLQRLAARLTAAVGARGRAFRLGGDEFCVLLTLPEGASRGAIRDCLAALSESGPGFDIAASHGVAELPADADTPSGALSTADARMYAAKERRRAERAPSDAGAPEFVAQLVRVQAPGRSPGSPPPASSPASPSRS